MKKTREMCIECRDNFYNGNNQYGVNECWHFDKAEIVERQKVHISQVPPWKQKTIKVLSCRQESGYVFVNQNE